MSKQKSFHSATCVALLLVLIFNIAACASGGNKVAPEAPVVGTPSDGARPSPQPVESPQLAAASSAEPEQATATPEPAEPGSENQSPSDNGQSTVIGLSDNDKVVITFVESEYSRSFYEPLIEKFNKLYPNITVQFVAFPESQDPAANYDLLLASAGDTFIWSPTFYNVVYLHDLQPLLETDSTFEADDFWPGALEGCQDMVGRQWGVPLSLRIQGIYFDKKAFDAAGLPWPKPGWTWDDFRRAVTTLAKKDGDIIRYGYAESYMYLLEPLIEVEIENNGDEIDPPALQEALQWYLDLVNAQVIYPPLYYEPGDDAAWRKQWEEWDAMFQSEERPAMWPGSLGESLPGAGYVMSSDDPLAGTALVTDGFLPYPVSADAPSEHTTPITALCAAVSAGSEHPREAWAWLNFLSQQQLVRETAGAWERLQLPARQSVTEAVNYWDGLSVELQGAIRFAVDHGRNRLFYQGMIWVVTDAVNRAASGNADFITTLEQNVEGIPNLSEMSDPVLSVPIVVATPQPTLSADVSVIDYYYSVWGPDRDALDVLIEEYNQAHPDVAVKLIVDYSGDATEEDYMAGVAETFDCFTYSAPYWPEANEENFVALDTLAEAEGADFLQDFNQTVMEEFRWDGKLYALPAFSQPQVMAYNADLLEKRGLQPPSNDWTFDDFLDLAARASSANDPSYGMIVTSWDNFLLNGRNVRWFDNNVNPAAARLNGPEFISALAWIVDLKASGTILVQVDENWQQADEAMRTGQVAFWVTQAGMEVYNWYYGEEAPFKVGVAPLPGMENPNESTAWAGDMGHFISASSDNVQACWSWIKFLSDHSDVFAGIPVRKSVVESPTWQAKVGPENAAAYRVVLERAYRPDYDEEFSYDPITGPYYFWRQQIVAAALKGEDYQKLASEVQQMADDYLVCMAVADRERLTEEEYYNEISRCTQQVDPDLGG